MQYVSVKLSTVHDLNILRIACQDETLNHMRSYSFNLEGEIFLDDTWEPIEEFSGSLSGSGGGWIIWGQEKIKPLFHKLSNASVNNIYIRIGSLDGGGTLDAEGFLETEDELSFGCVACVAEKSSISVCGAGRGTIRFNGLPSGKTVNFGSIVGVFEKSTSSYNYFSMGGVGAYNSGSSSDLRPLSLVTDTTNKVNIGSQIGLIKSTCSSGVTVRPISHTIFSVTIQAPNAASGSAIGAIVGSAGSIRNSIPYTQDSYDTDKPTNYSINFMAQCSSGSYVGIVGYESVAGSDSVISMATGGEYDPTLTLYGNVNKIVGNKENNNLSFFDRFNYSSEGKNVPNFPDA